MPADDDHFSTGIGARDRVLVIGGSGFLGTNLVAAYRQAGRAAVNADLLPPRDPADETWTQVDVTDLGQLDRVISDVEPTFVFHLGARTDLEGDDVSEYPANVEGVANVMSMLGQRASVRRVVVASSRLVCRIGYQPTSDEDYCPTTAYGASKVETERLVRAETSPPWVLVRPTSIWGPWFGTPYRDFFLNVARGRYVHPRGARVEKSFGYVGNTVRQLHSLMTAPEEKVLSRTFYLADAPPIEVHDFADRIRSALGQTPTRQVPLPALKVAARAGDGLQRLRRSAPLTSFRLDNLLTPMVHDLAPLTEVAGDPVYDLNHSVSTTVAWMREHGLVAAPDDG